MLMNSNVFEERRKKSNIPRSQQGYYILMVIL